MTVRQVLPAAVTRQAAPTLALQVLAVAAAYYLGARAGLLLAEVNDQVTPLWPPTGIALAAFLVLGPRVWPGVALGAFVANAALGPLDVAAAIAVGNTLAPLVAYVLLRRAGFRTDLSRKRDAAALVLLGSMAGMAVSATLGTLTLVLAGSVPASAGWTTWWVWWAGDGAGVLVFTPLLLLLLDAPRLLRTTTTARRVEWVGLMAATLAISSLAVVPKAGILFVVIPVLVWTALRFGLAGASPALLITVVVIDIASGLEIGTFAMGSVLDRMARLEAFVGVSSISALLVAALVAERRSDRQSAERALEGRVEARTEELSATVARLQRSEHALRGSEQRFRRLVDGAPDALLVVDRDGIVSLANTKAAKLFGCEEGQLVGLLIDNLVPEGSRAAHAANRDRFLTDPRDRPMGTGDVLRARRRDGSEFPVDVSLSPIPGPDGLLVVAAVRDLTERLKAEEAARLLRETEQRTEQALEINDHVVQGLSKAAYAIERGDPATASRAVSSTLVAARKVIANLVPPGSPVVALPPLPSAPSGESSAAPKQPGSSGRLRVVIADDTADLRAMVRAMLETLTNVEVVAEATNGLEAVQACISLQPDLLLLDLSMPVMNGMEALVQVRTCAPGTKVVVLSGYARDQAAVDALSRGAAAYVEKGGSGRRLVTLIEDLFPGRVQVAGATAVPEASAAEPRPPASEAAVDLVSVYVHELRNPLAAASGIAELLADELVRDGGAAHPELLPGLQRSLRKMNRLVDSLSEANRIGAGDLSLAIEPVDLVDLVRTSIRDDSELLDGRPVHMLAEGPAVIPADPFRIRQVIENLLSNAAKFSPRGTPIDVRVTSGPAKVAICVTDHGPGVPEEKRPLLFQRFQRLGTNVPGIGLGLYLSREIARAHHGDLEYRGEPACMFRLTLPRLQAEDA